MKNCLIIAGEKSGEEHCLSFLPLIKKSLPELSLWGVGGEALQSQGVELLYHLKEFSSWGVSGVIHKIPFYYKALKKIETEVDKRNTKYAILVDFQTFNLMLAKRLAKNGVKVLYFVAPQAWAWKAWRTKTLEKYVHTLFTILPFEKEWFKRRGVQRVVSVPHPLWYENVSLVNPRDYYRPFQEIEKCTRILILPGSRNFEVQELLKIFIDAIESINKYRKIEVRIVESPSVNSALYGPYKKYFNKSYQSDQLIEALKWADFSFAASGTVTLSLALYGVVSCIGYRSSYLNQFIYENFISYKGPISLANIVHEQLIFPEFIQDDCCAYELEKSFELLLQKEKYEKVRKTLESTIELISGGEVHAGELMAKIIGNEE